MSSNGTRKLFDEVDANHDGKIDRKELSRWTGGRRNGDVTISSPKIIKRNFSTRSRSGADFVGDAGANAVFDRMDSNRNNVIERSEFNRFARNGSIAVNKSSTANYLSRYRVDSRGFFVDPNPEIIIRPNPNPPATYKQKIIIRYLRPPPLRQVVENIIREVRPPPLKAPPPLVIREGGKPGGQPPPLVLRERPPEPPPATRGFEKTVIVAPLPAPPRSVVTEKFPNLPDRPRDIILERWLPYEVRRATRTVRIPAPDGPLPDPPRNRIIQYQPLQVSIVRKFRRLGVTLADPRIYIQQYGDSLLDSHRFIQKVRALGIVEDISLPAGAAVGFTSSSYDQAEDLTGSFLGDASENIINGSSEYSRDVGSGGAFKEFQSSERIIGGSGFSRGFDIDATTVHSDEITSDTEDRPFLNGIFKKKKIKYQQTNRLTSN